MKKNKIITITILLIIGFIVRLYGINNPVADWHSWRQADTASVTRNFINDGINLLHPTFHDFSNIPSGKDNPQGWRMVEFPIYNAITATIYKNINFLNLTPEVVGRLINIIFSLSSAILIYFIIFDLTNSFLPSLLGLTIFLFLPFNIFYSRTILPEPTGVFFMLLSLYLFPKKIILSSIPFAISLLIKPYIALLLFPPFCFHIFNLFKNKFNKKLFLKFFIFGIIGFIPFALWRLWIKQYPEGIPASNWLFNGGNMRFRPVWFRWLFYERISKLILSVFGLVPFVVGFAYNHKKIQFFSFSLFLGIILYFSIIARGNIQHDYYQVLIVPFISIITGFGLYYISTSVFKPKVLGILISLILFISTIVFSFYEIKGYYQINNPAIINAGQKASEILPKNAVVIAPYNGDTAFLYQTQRSGWPIEIYDIENIKKQHSNNPFYLISVNFDNYTNNMSDEYKTIFKNDQFIILDLN